MTKTQTVAHSLVRAFMVFALVQRVYYSREQGFKYMLVNQASYVFLLVPCELEHALHIAMQNWHARFADMHSNPTDHDYDIMDIVDYSVVISNRRYGTKYPTAGLRIVRNPLFERLNELEEQLEACSEL